MAPIFLTIRASDPIELSESQGVLLAYAVLGPLTLISALFLALRFVAIWYRKIILVADDGLLIASWVMTLFYAITAYTELAFGLGTPTGADNAVAIRLLDNIARTFALVAAAWAKTAFACSLLGLARDSRRTWWTLWFAIVSLNAVTVGVCVAHWLRCVPVNKAWDDSVASGRCWKKTVQNDVDLVAQAYSAFINILLVVVGYLLAAADLKLRYKTGVVGLMFLGLMASAAAIITGIEITTLTDANFTAANIRVLVPAAIEPALIIIASSLPALAALKPQHPRSWTFNGTLSLRPGRLFQRHSSLRPTISPPTTTPRSMTPPPRPRRLSSSGSFLTENSLLKSPPSTAQYDPEKAALQGIEYNYAYWNPSIPPTTIPSSTPPPKSRSGREGHKTMDYLLSPSPPPAVFAGSPTKSYPSPDAYPSVSPYATSPTTRPPRSNNRKRLTTLQENQQYRGQRIEVKLDPRSIYSWGSWYSEESQPGSARDGQSVGTSYYERRIVRGESVRSTDSDTLGPWAKANVSRTQQRR